MGEGRGGSDSGVKLIPRCGGGGGGGGHRRPLKSPLSRFDAVLKFLLQPVEPAASKLAAAVVVGGIIWFLLLQIIDPEEPL